MNAKVFIALTLAVSLVAGSASPRTVPCHYIAADGTQYDLTALTILRGDPYVYSDKDGKIYFNICGTLAGLKPNPCNTESSICLVDNNGVSSNAGSVSKSEWFNSAVNPESGVELIYQNGDTCENGQRKTSLMFKCVTDSFTSSSMRVSSVERSGCNTAITIETIYGCPVKEDSDDDTPDSNVVDSDSDSYGDSNSIGGGWDDSDSVYRHFHAANLLLVMMVSFFSTLMCLCLCACLVRKRKCKTQCKKTRNATEMAAVSEPLLQQVVHSNSEVAVGIPYPYPYAYAQAPFVPSPSAAQQQMFYYSNQLPVNPPEYTVATATAPTVIPIAEDQVSADERFARQLQAHFNTEQ